MKHFFFVSCLFFTHSMCNYYLLTQNYQGFSTTSFLKPKCVYRHRSVVSVVLLNYVNGLSPGVCWVVTRTLQLLGGTPERTRTIQFTWPRSLLLFHKNNGKAFSKFNTTNFIFLAHDATDQQCTVLWLRYHQLMMQQCYGYVIMHFNLSC